jgi:hypothetical protein
MNTKKYISHLINGETDNAKIDAIILGFAKKVEMTASLKNIDIDGVTVTGIFIDGQLNSAYENPFALIAEMDRLKAIGYTIDLA